MTPEEFFRVLKDSQLERAFPWYYQTGWPLVVFLSSLICWVYLLGVSIARLVKDFEDIRARPEVMNLGLARLMTDPAIILDVSRLGAATIALLVTYLALRIQQNPVLLLSRVHPSTDSLYDLTPVGVQFVVDFLFWLTLLSLISCFCLWTIAATVIWIEMRGVTPVQWLWKLRSAGPSGRIKGGSQVLVLAMPPLLLLLLVVLLDMKFDFANSQARISEQAVLLEKCRTQDTVTFVEQNWSETDTDPRLLHARFVIRFSQSESPNQMDVLYDVGDNERKKCQLELVPTVDPLDIAILPVLEPDLDPIQSKFAALVLRELLAQFELVGAVDRDRVQLFLPKPSGTDITEPLLWPEAAANALFSYSEDVEPVGFDIAEQVLKVADELEEINRQDNVSQAYGPQLIILFRWFPVQQPSELVDADAYKNLMPEHAAEGRQPHVWIVDLVSNSQQSIADNLDSSVGYLKVQVPSVLIDPETMQMKTAVPRQSLQNGNVDDRIEKLRSTRQWGLTTNKVWASRDSKPIRLFLGEDAGCYVEVPLETPIGRNSKMPGVTEVNGPATARFAFIAILFLGLIYPSGIILVGIFQIAIKSESTGNKS